MKKIIILSLLVLFSAGSHAKLRAIKCQSGFAKVEDLKYEIVSNCGEPLMIERVSGNDDIKIERATYNVNGWIYDFIYRAGMLVEITRLKRA